MADAQADLQQATRRLQDFVRGRARACLKVLVPVDLNYIGVTCRFNMHVLSEGTYQSLHPLSTLHDVARVFFTVEDWDLWSLILTSHSLHDPQFHLEEAARESYRRFELMPAFKTVLLLRRAEDKTLHHYLRPLYSSFEALTPIL